jgi:hypothetical protein
MTIKQIVTTSAVLLALAAPAIAQDPEPATRAAAAAARAAAAQQRVAAQAEAARQRAAARVERDVNGKFKVYVGPIDTDAIYEQARQAIENSQYDRAIADFNRVLADSAKGRADAAMYWKAYSQSKLEMSREALDTVAELAKQFAASPWVKDAKALAVEIQSAAGQPVSAELQNDEELKLLALRGVMQADPDKGVPIIEKMLAGGASPRVRDRALFVLSQSRAARAREVILNTAKNNTNPDLQRSAIRYLGMMGGADDRDALTGVYRTAADVSVKRTVINSLFMQRNAKALVDLARGEKDPSLKKDIVSKLSVMKTPEATDYMLELLK